MDRLTQKYLRSRKIPSTACSGCGLGQAGGVLEQAAVVLVHRQGLAIGALDGALAASRPESAIHERFAQQRARLVSGLETEP